MSVRHVNLLRYNQREKSNKNIFTFLFLVFICMRNTKSLLHLLVERYYMFRVKNNHSKTVAHKIGTSANITNLEDKTDFMLSIQRDIKILYALQQVIRSYAGNLIYGVRLQVNVGDILAKKFSIVSMKLNDDDIFSFPNKIKFDDSNICTKLLILEPKTINNCPSDTSISLK